MSRRPELPPLKDGELAQVVGPMAPAEESKLKDDVKRLRWGADQLGKILAHFEGLHDRGLRAEFESALHYLEERMEDSALEKIQEVRASRLRAKGDDPKRGAREGGVYRGGIYISGGRRHE